MYMKMTKISRDLLGRDSGKRTPFTDDETFALREYVKVKRMLDELRTNVERRHSKGSVQQKIQEMRREIS